MSQIHWMANVRTNSRDHKKLLLISQNFSDSADLLSSEISRRLIIERKSAEKEDSRNSPTPPVGVQRHSMPMESCQREDYPHCNPHRQQDTVWRSALGS